MNQNRLQHRNPSGLHPKNTSKLNIVHALRFRSLGLTNSYFPSSSLQACPETQAASRCTEKSKVNFSSNTRSTFITAFSPDHKYVASGHGDHNVYVTDLKTEKIKCTLSGHQRTPWCITFHPAYNGILATGCLGGEVRVWDLNSGGSESWTSKPTGFSIASLSFHPFDQILMIAVSNNIYFWDWNHSIPFAKVTTNEVFEEVRLVRFDSRGDNILTGVRISQDSNDKVKAYVKDNIKPTKSSKRWASLEGMHHANIRGSDSTTSLGQRVTNRSNVQENGGLYLAPTILRSVSNSRETNSSSPLLDFPTNLSSASAHLSELYTPPSGESFNWNFPSELNNRPNEVSSLPPDQVIPSYPQSPSRTRRIEEDLPQRLQSYVRRRSRRNRAPFLNRDQSSSNPHYTQASTSSTSIYPNLDDYLEIELGHNRNTTNQAQTSLQSSSNNLLTASTESTTDLFASRSLDFAPQQTPQASTNSEGEILSARVSVNAEIAHQYQRLRVLRLERQRLEQRLQQIRDREWNRTPDSTTTSTTSTSSISTRSRFNFPFRPIVRWWQSLTDTDRSFSRTLDPSVSREDVNLLDFNTDVPQYSFASFARPMPPRRELPHWFFGSRSYRSYASRMENDIYDYRLQYWDFSRFEMPDLTKPYLNVVVRGCKLYNDSSVDVSKDSKRLVCFFSSVYEGTYIGHKIELAVVSLQKHDQGSILHSVRLDLHGVSLSLSPGGNYVAVGVKKMSELVEPRQSRTQAVIVKLTEDGKAKIIRSLMNDSDDTFSERYMCANTISWLPDVGEGLLYGTNCGELHFCRIPSFTGHFCN